MDDGYDYILKNKIARIYSNQKLNIKGEKNYGEIRTN